jgi:predicted nucleotidyltransferase
MSTESLPLQFGLKPSTIECINQVFAQYPEIEQAVLYGSRAKGNYRRGSDIDLTVTYPTDPPTAHQIGDYGVGFRDFGYSFHRLGTPYRLHELCLDSA